MRAHDDGRASGPADLSLEDETGALPTAVLTSTDDGAEEPELKPGTSIGRYVVKDVLGRGGMGIVYRAHDPDLGRDVAVKLVRVAEGTGSGGSPHSVRMLREAQALAKLSHPNIVTVHDVGTFGQRVFLAMEFIEGRTLGAFVREEAPPLRKTLAVLVAVGRGLAAAHVGGLVHRDVKPDNVFVAADGRARIGDFGLARSVEVKSGERIKAPDLDAVPFSPDTLTGEVLHHQVTLAGAVLGTPQYMSPEQFRGELADAASDQFSFCVTAWEALYGERPFSARTLNELAQRVASGAEPDAPRRPRLRVPRRIQRILCRGLRPSPGERYPTLTALLDDLERDPLRTPLRVLLAVGLVAAGATLAMVSMREAPSPCAGGDDRFSAVFGPGARARLEGAFVATGRPYAHDTFVRVANALDLYGAGYRAARREACEAARERGVASALDPRTACLDAQLDSVQAFVSVFAGTIDGTALDRAVEGAGRLPRIQTCAATGLTAVPPARASQVARVRRELARAQALFAAARYPDALHRVERLALEARTVGDLRLEAEVQRLWATLLAEQGGAAQAEAPLFRALALSARARDARDEAAISLDALYDIGYAQARHRDATAFLPFVEAAVLRAGEPEFDARLASTTCLIRWAEGDYARARAGCERSVTLAEASHLPPAQHAHYLNNLGLVVNDAGDPARALEVYGRALAEMERGFGARHPNVAMVLNNRGNAQNDLGRYEAAAADFARSLSLWEAALGPSHGDLSYPLTNLGAVSIRLGRFEEARPLLERAVALDERYLGASHPDLGFSLTSLGDAYVGLGRHADARRVLERALAIRRANDVPKVRLAETLFFLAKAVTAEGHAADAARLLEEMRKALGDEATVVARDLRARIATWEAERR